MVLIFTLLSLLFGICCFVVQPPMILLNNNDDNVTNVVEEVPHRKNFIDSNNTLYLSYDMICSPEFFVTLVAIFSDNVTGNPGLSLWNGYDANLSTAAHYDYYPIGVANYWSVAYFNQNDGTFTGYHSGEPGYSYNRVILGKWWDSEYVFHYQLLFAPLDSNSVALGFECTGFVPSIPKSDEYIATNYNFDLTFNRNYNSGRYLVCHRYLDSYDIMYQVYRNMNATDEFLADSYYKNGYQDGYNAARDTFNDNEYQRGYTNGWTAGNNTGLADGYQNGYTAGYNDGGSQDDTAAAIFVGITEVGLLPVNVFLSMFNYEIFGVNISGLISALITVTITIIIFRFLLGRKND